MTSIDFDASTIPSILKSIEKLDKSERNALAEMLSNDSYFDVPRYVTWLVQSLDKDVHLKWIVQGLIELRAKNGEKCTLHVIYDNATDDMFLLQERFKWNTETSIDLGRLSEICDNNEYAESDKCNKDIVNRWVDWIKARLK